MEGELNRDAKKVLENIKLLILAEKARGGYKYRQRIRLSNRELKDFIDKEESKLRTRAISLIVAEQMLQETKPAYQAYHNRWEEYIRRRSECMAWLSFEANQKSEKSKK